MKKKENSAVITKQLSGTKLDSDTLGLPTGFDDDINAIASWRPTLELK